MFVLTPHRSFKARSFFSVSIPVVRLSLRHVVTFYVPPPNPLVLKLPTGIVSIWSHLDSVSSLYYRCLSVYCVRESSATRLMV